MFENIVVGVVVAFATVYVVWMIVRAARPSKDGCGAGCGCGSSLRENRLGERKELISLKTDGASTQKK